MINSICIFVLGNYIYYNNTKIFLFINIRMNYQLIVMYMLSLEAKNV